MSDDSPWLSPDEQLLWRRWVRLNALLPVVLHRELRADAMTEVVTAILNRVGSPDG